MSSRPLLLGHRGARAIRSIPENTFASFDLALEHGCAGFEFDVRLTADGRAVLCHDPKVGGIEIARAMEGDLEGLPRFEEVLARYSRSAFLDIELKVAGLETQIRTLLREQAPARGYVVSSFVPEVLLDLGRFDASVPLGLICESKDQLARWPELPVSYVIPHWKLVNQDLIDRVHHEGRKLLVWTVNDKEAMLRLADWGVDGIISDDTELLAGTMGKKTDI